jgi:hypothetical protein
MSSMWLDDVGRMTLDNTCFMYKERKKERRHRSQQIQLRKRARRREKGSERIPGHTHGFNCQGTDERARCSHRLALDDMTNSWSESDDGAGPVQFQPGCWEMDQITSPATATRAQPSSATWIALGWANPPSVSPSRFPRSNNVWAAVHATVNKQIEPIGFGPNNVCSGVPRVPAWPHPHASHAKPPTCGWTGQWTLCRHCTKAAAAASFRVQTPDTHARTAKGCSARMLWGAMHAACSAQGQGSKACICMH